jgi:hypothetical protein
VGGDLWGGVAVAVLKRKLRREVERRWSEQINSSGEQVKEEQLNGDVADTAEPVESSSASQPSSPRAAPSTTDISLASNPSKQSSSPTQRKDLLTQSLFDILLLQLAFSIPFTTSETEDKLLLLAAEIKKEIDLGSSEEKRLKASAEEYWKRSGLLFGLLL